MKTKKINNIISIIYIIFTLISSFFLVKELIMGINKYGLKEVTVFYLLVLIIAMYMGIVTSFFGPLIQIIGGFLLAGITGLGTIAIGFMVLIEVLFYANAEDVLILLFFIALLGFAIGKIVLGFMCYKLKKRGV